MAKWGKSSSHVKKFIYNSPISTCACRNYLYVGNMAKIGQNGDKHGYMEQVDVTGGQGPLGSATRHHMGAAQPPKWPCHVTDPWELLQSQSQASIQGGLINEQDLFTVDPWAYCIDLGASTDLPTTIATEFHHVLASQQTWRSHRHPSMQRRCIQRSASAPMPPLGPLWPPTSLLPTSTPHASLHYK